jgi:hypothetical protein
MEERLDVIFELQDRRVTLANSLIYMILGIILTVGGFFLKGTFHWILWSLGGVSMIMFLVRWFGRDENNVMITNDRLIIKTRAMERTILLTDIQRVELTYQENGTLKRLPFFNLNHLKADEQSLLAITDIYQKRIEILAKDFLLTDFQGFLEEFQRNGKASSVIDDGKLKELIEQNQSYLRKDKELRFQLEKSLYEAHKALYHQRGLYFLKENPTAKVMHQYQPNPNETYLFIENDYLPNLNAESLAIAKNMLETTAQNMQVVRQRIECYESIAQQLNDLKKSYEATIQMKRVAGKVERLQQQNEYSQQAENQEHQLQVETLKQLQLLTQEVNGLSDLNQILLLKERSNLL